MEVKVYRWRLRVEVKVYGWRLRVEVKVYGWRLRYTVQHGTLYSYGYLMDIMHTLCTFVYALHFIYWQTSLFYVFIFKQKKKIIYL